MTKPPVRTLPLTPRQLQVLEFVGDYWCEHLMPPTICETMLEFGFTSPNAVMCHLRPLLAAGVLVRAEGGRARSLTIPGLRDAVGGPAEEFLAAMLARLGGGGG